ncbi:MULTISPECIES: hypothetical protein [Priestia]|nr:MULTISPECIES: hypothetical protein [Priestia]
MESYEKYVKEIGGEVIKVNPEMKNILHSLRLQEANEEEEQR